MSTPAPASSRTLASAERTAGLTDREVGLILDACDAIRAACVAAEISLPTLRACTVVGGLRDWTESMRDNGRGARTDLRADALLAAISRTAQVAA